MARAFARTLVALLVQALIAAGLWLATAKAWADPVPPAFTPSQITVVVNRDYPPFAFIDADGQPRGYAVDLWQLFEKRTGIQVDLRLLDNMVAQRAVLQVNADVIGAVQRTPEREPLYDFDETRLPMATSIYVSGDILGVNDPATLRGFQVAMEDGSACLEYLKSAGITDLRPYPGNESLIAAIAQGSERVFCMDDYAANYYLGRSKLHGDFNKAFTLHYGELHRAVAKGHAGMLALVQSGMLRISVDEKKELARRWLKPPTFFAEHAHLIYSAAGLALGLLALLGLWIYLLRKVVMQRTREVFRKQQSLRSLFDAIPDLILIKDMQGCITDCNKSTMLAFDKVTKRIKGSHARDLLLPRDTAELSAIEARVMGSGKAEIFFVERMREDGQIAHEEILITPMRDRAGQVTGTVSVVHDITHRLKMQDDLRLWAHAVRRADFGVQILDIETRTITAVNDHFARERGYEPHEMQGMPFLALFPNDVAVVQESHLLDVGQNEHQIVETEHVRRYGERFPVLLDRSVYRDAEGQPRYVVVYAQDITERKRAQAEQRLAAVAFETQDATMVLDSEGCILRVNQAFMQLTLYAQADMLGCEPFFLQAQDNEQGLSGELCKQVCEQKGWKGPLWLQPREGKPRVVRANISAVVDKETGRASHFICALVDVTSEREAHARAKRLTFFDALTNLPNRDHLFGQIEHIIHDSASCGGVLLVIDLDHFKRVNELQGHAAGDELLVLIAQRLRALQGPHDNLARLSGGVFAWLIAREGNGDGTCSTTCVQVADHVCEALTQPFELAKGQMVRVTASIGWYAFAPSDASPEEIFKRAELAMYAAKEGGRDQVCRFEPEMYEALKCQENLLAELRADLAQPSGGGFQLFAQPKFDREGEVHSAELLLRWRRLDGQMCPPDQFIPLAEENGLIEPLGAWVLQQACCQLADWAGHPRAQAVSLAVNVSAHQFVQPQFLPLVRHMLQAHGAPPERLILEITESALLGDLQPVAARLMELRELGVRISLDDFGTGYSSLSYLSRLPIDELKIDRSFIMRLPHEPVDVTVAQTVMAMARGLGLQVVAEGVETPEQREWLVQHGCDLLQGYLLARPMPLAECERFLEALEVGVTESMWPGQCLPDVLLET